MQISQQFVPLYICSHFLRTFFLCVCEWISQNFGRDISKQRTCSVKGGREERQQNKRQTTRVYVITIIIIDFISSVLRMICCNRPTCIPYTNHNTLDCTSVCPSQLLFQIQLGYLVRTQGWSYSGIFMMRIYVNFNMCCEKTKTYPRLPNCKTNKSIFYT